MLENEHHNIEKLRFAQPIKENADRALNGPLGYKVPCFTILCVGNNDHGRYLVSIGGIITYMYL